MDMKRVVGIVVPAVGAVLLGFAYNATQAPVEELSNTITGRYSNETMWYFGVGIAAVVGGWSARPVRKLEVTRRSYPIQSEETLIVVFRSHMLRPLRLLMSKYLVRLFSDPG